MTTQDEINQESKLIEISAALRVAKANKCYTALKIAQISGLNKNTVYNAMKGKVISLTALLTLCFHLDLDLNIKQKKEDKL